MSLDLIRNKHSWLTRILLVVLAGTFIIGFGYMGGINIGGGPTGGPAVVVNGERISLAQYYLMRDNIYRQYAQGRDDLPPQAMDFIKFTALNRLVEIKLLAQQARELGFRVTEDELGKYIRSLPYFQRDGKFIGAQDYQRIIKEGLNLTVTEFESGIRDELVLQKLVSLMVHHVFQ